MCQEDCNATWNALSKCIYFGPLCSVFYTDLVLLVLEIEVIELR